MQSNVDVASPMERASRPTPGGPGNLGGHSRWVLAGLLVAALAVLVATGFAVFSDWSGASDPPPLGIYLGYENASGVSSLGHSVGQEPSYAMDYLDATSWSAMESSAADEAASWSGSGYAMTFSIPMLPASGGTLADGAAGDYDSSYRRIALGLVANDEASSILRIGWEFNGSWNSWYADSSDRSQFVSFWRQIVTTMRSVPGADFKFEWCPNVGDTTDDLADYYPGNSYVDVIAEDVYDQAWSTYPGASTEFSDLEAEPYGLDWLISFAAQQGKPVSIGEWGLGNGPGNDGRSYAAGNEEVSGGDDPTFIDDMAEWLARNHVAEATYFDFQSMGLSSQQNPNSYRAFLKDFGPGGVAGGSAGSSPTTPPPALPGTTAAPGPTTSWMRISPPPLH